METSLFGSGTSRSIFSFHYYIYIIFKELYITKKVLLEWIVSKYALNISRERENLVQIADLSSKKASSGAGFTPLNGST